MRGLILPVVMVAIGVPLLFALQPAVGTTAAVFGAVLLSGAVTAAIDHAALRGSRVDRRGVRV